MGGIALSMTEAERLRALRRAQRHSILVRVLRVTLPVCAVLVAGAYFYTSKISFNFNGGKASVERVEFASDQLKMINPKMEGFSEEAGKYLVQADQALQNVKTPSLINLTAISAKITNEDNSWSNMRAKAGVFETKKELLDLSGGIEITTNSGMSAALSSARVNMKKQLITSAKPVVVNMLNGEMRAQTMALETKKRNAHFAGNVQVHLKRPARQTPAPAQTRSQLSLDSNQPIDITSQKLSVFDQKKIAHFSENVIAVQGQYRMTASQLKVAYIGGANAFTNAGNKTESDANEAAEKNGGEKNGSDNIRTIEALENVVIRAADGQKATGQRALFDNKAQTLTMSGGVVLTRGKSRLSGPQLMVNLASGKSTLGPDQSPAQDPIQANKRINAFFMPAQTQPNKPAPARSPRKVQLGQSQLDLSRSKGKPIKISSTHLFIDDTAKTAIFSGKVQTSQGDFRLAASELKVDYTAAPLGGQGASAQAPQNANIRFIHARKKVLITTADKQTITSDWAEYNVKAEVMTIGGNVALSQSGNIIKADKVVIDLKTGTSTFVTKRRNVQQQGQPGRQRIRAKIMPGQIDLKKFRQKPQ